MKQENSTDTLELKLIVAEGTSDGSSRKVVRVDVYNSYLKEAASLIQQDLGVVVKDKVESLIYETL